MTTIMVLNGPNLNLLGIREPEVYGHDTLEDINESLRAQVEGSGLTFVSHQSNAEHELVELVQSARNDVDFIIINPGAFTHTSVALRDALLGVAIPFVEVHLSNVFSREEFRRHSFLSDIAVGCITGLGAQGYSLAAEYAIDQLKGA